MREFSRRVRQELDAPLGQLGFEYVRGLYRRAQPSGLEHRIGLGNKGYDTDVFEVLVGFGDALIASDGFMLARYFTGGSLANVRKDLPCPNETVLSTRLRRLISEFSRVLEPFFDSVRSRQELADALRGDPLADYVRGQLYLLGGDKQRARAELVAYLERVDGRVPDDHPQLAEVKALLVQCETP
jgi:hypothetical protein